MDGRAGAVALNVRQMLTPPRGSCVPESPAPDAEDEHGGGRATLKRTPRSSAIAIDSARGAAGSAGLEDELQRACPTSKEELRERLVIAEARVAAAASSKARAQHMAAHLRDMLSPQATHTNSRVSSPSGT
jgi:hypothetical protein